MTNQNKNSNKNEYAITIDRAWELSKKWRKTAVWWRIVDHAFVLISFAASMVAAYVAAEVPSAENVIIITSSLAALSTMMGFACTPSRDMMNYRKAFGVLNDALVTNTKEDGQLINTDEGRKAIVDAIKLGEKYISETLNVKSDTKNLVSAPCRCACAKCCCQKAERIVQTCDSESESERRRGTGGEPAYSSRPCFDAYIDV